MHNRRMYILSGGIALALILGFALSAPHLREVKLAATSGGQGTLPAVYLHDSYRKGLHTITGQVQVPDACTGVSASADAAASSSIVVSLTMPASEGTCLMLPATTTFSVSVAAAQGAELRATINGTDASTTRY
jgi:hypothetical protein